jgi:hypothetical protein
MDDLKSALSALTNRKVKVEFPNGLEAFVRPLPMKVNIGFIVDAEGENDQDKDDDIHVSSLAYSLVDKDGNQVFTKDEFTEFYSKAEWDLLQPLIDAMKSLNDFSGKSTEAKKK